MKRGRPRKAEEPLATGVQLHRVRALGAYPILEVPFGQLAYMGAFTQYQVDTREKVFNIYREHRSHMGTSGNVASPSLEVGIGRSPVFEDDEGKERAEKALKAFNRVQDVLARFPPWHKAAFETVCIDELACPPSALNCVRMVLDVLADALGYKIRKKRLDISRKVND